MLKKLFLKLNGKSVRQGHDYTMVLNGDLEETVKSIKNIVGESDDILQRNFLIGKKIQAALFFVDGLCDSNSIEEDIIRPLMYFVDQDHLNKNNLLTYIQNEVVTLSEVKTEDSLEKAMLPLLSGETILVIDGIKKLILFETRQFNERSIAEPESEVVVRGPRDGFVETLHTNILQIRRRVRDPNLTVQFGTLGRRGKSDFAILYLKGIANEKHIKEMRYRIACVDNDQVSETGTLEQFIEDNVLSIFPQMLRTERPDKTVSALMSGQVVVLKDGSPFSLMAPVTFHMLFRSPEDYYDRWHISSLIRMLRYLAAFIAVFLPALYIAMVSYHQGMIPTYLAISIAGSREGVPFPAFVEAIIMEVTIELLREAGVRLPRAVGQTIGIVGGLVIGEAAVRAGIVSPIMVIVVALTAIASFAIPAYNVSITLRILRFVMMLSAASFGLYGIVIVYIFLNIHLVGLRSLGTYYTSPFAPYRFKEWKDLIVRLPISVLTNRFSELHPKDKEKQG
ncbi:spore germination protein [Anaerobacillus isosaccharinicus]|uniref:Spore germination protein n=1 Tax=Anaerobacillus isosaccharinicus TaxID=1532552 RepID=A0A1S2KTZ1_9BACI|nr:spore germination protein [Anaerobacillus isosaccharinicus]MBA5585330.1 spore germination protein [Anaerobacillus isosaccharinicus]QOY36344.1 spore germination protein [Anaerobacillus isosaccharinicus]